MTKKPRRKPKRPKSKPVLPQGEPVLPYAPKGLSKQDITLCIYSRPVRAAVLIYALFAESVCHQIAESVCHQITESVCHQIIAF